jgi:RHS repeat-associated protein
VLETDPACGVQDSKAGIGAGRPTIEVQDFAGPDAGVYDTDAVYQMDMTAHTITQQLCYPECGTRLVERTWDGRQRLIESTAGADLGVSWTFDATDRRIGATRSHPLQNFSSFLHDANGRLEGLAHFTGPAPQPPLPVVPSISETYGYDPMGNRTYAERGLSGETDRSELYGHDDLNRLTQVKRGTLTFTGEDPSIESGDFLVHPTIPNMQQWVNIDRRGNWLDFRESIAGVGQRRETRQANGVNEYAAIDPDDPKPAVVPDNTAPSATPAYDPAGNLWFNPWAKLPPADPCAGSTWADDCDSNGTCDATLYGCGLGQEYDYDAENRLIAVYRDTNDAPGPYDGSGVQTEPLVMEFRYDALGRRVETIEYVDAATGQLMDGQNGNPSPRRTRHVYFGLEQIQDYRYDEGPPPGFVRLKQFLWGDPDRYPEQVGMLVGEPGLELAYHFLHDALGSIVGVVSNSGVLAERTTYDPYGKPYVESYDPQSGTWNAQPTSTTANPFGFTGHRYDAAVGLYHTLFRSYDPTLGRWLQRDPIEYEAGTINLYEYAFSSPLNSIDPLGLESPIPNGNCGEPPPDEYEQDKCRAAANKALSNCLSSEKAGGPGAPMKDDCFETFHQSMDACARGKPGTHEKEVMAGFDYLDCVGNCIDAKYGELFGGIGLVASPGAGPIPKDGQLARWVAGRTFEIEGGRKVTSVGSALSVRLRSGSRSLLRTLGRSPKVGVVFWVDAGLAAAIEAACAVSCL